ncbi:MAG: hypothetical protein L7G96_01095 [Vulcanisaeta sp.]|nr:hypothetical protein [Vulcanisaeta sp.]MCG2894929.1 hypothetical protein [Vulcanisaeta sp.]
MSVLVRNYDDIYVECDMDYGKYVRDGINYVPCTVRGKNLDKALGMFRNYLNEHEILREIRINATNNALNLEIPTTTLNKGKSMGEIIDSLIHLLLGIRYCMTHLSPRNNTAGASHSFS